MGSCSRCGKWLASDSYNLCYSCNKLAKKDWRVKSKVNYNNLKKKGYI